MSIVYYNMTKHITHNGLSPCTSEHSPPFLLLPKQFHLQTNKFILLKSKGSRYLATWCTKRAKRDALLLCDRIPEKTFRNFRDAPEVCRFGVVLIGVKGRYTHVFLFGGFNPFEKYWSNWIISPSRGKNKKYLKPPPSFWERRNKALRWMSSQIQVDETSSTTMVEGTSKGNMFN